IRRCQKRGATTGNTAMDASSPANGSPHASAGALGCMALTLQVTSAPHNGNGPMDMTGERRIDAPREAVWQAPHDPEVLKASIPGCEPLERLSDTDMKATAAVKIGPISARFRGEVHLSDLDPPNGYSIGGEGQGGVAGFAKGGAKVR